MNNKYNTGVHNCWQYDTDCTKFSKFQQNMEIFMIFQHMGHHNDDNNNNFTNMLKQAAAEAVLYSYQAVSCA